MLGRSLQHDVEIQGRTRRVVVERTGDRLTIAIDGRTFRVDAARVDRQTLSLLVAGRSYDVTVTPDAASAQLAVHVGTTPLLVALDGRRRREKQADDVPAGTGPQRIVAPMPGKVVRLLVRSGETVRARQPVVVVEAMKMENELRAGRDGTVAEIHTQEGLSVDAGALLVVIL